jgi:hypothetical protein
MEKHMEENINDISSTPDKTHPALELGDVIEITAPSNTEIH